jgi:hypothetical protein
MSMWASTATNEPSASSASGLISASVMSYSRTAGEAGEDRRQRVSARPVTPTEAMTCLAS